MVLTPLTVGASWGEGISIVKSRFGRGYCLTALGTAWAAMVMLPTTEAGESPLEDGDMSYSSGQSLFGGRPKWTEGSDAMSTLSLPNNLNQTESRPPQHEPVLAELFCCWRQVKTQL